MRLARTPAPDSAPEHAAEHLSDAEVDDVIGRRSVTPAFQPIVSVRRGHVVGVEALSRAQTGDGRAISPAALFAAAERSGRALALDRVCRERALAEFAPLHRADADLILFANCHASTFEHDADGSAGWPAAASRHGVDPRNIAIELPESELVDGDALRDAIRTYQRRGFLIVADDVGVRHANLDRVANLRPDILKADRSLVAGIAEDHYRQAVFRALVTISEAIGGWVVGEGVEAAADVQAALDLGGDLFQGFYFDRPAPRRQTLAGHLGPAIERTRTTAEQFRGRTLDRVARLWQARTARAAMARHVAAAVTATADGEAAPSDEAIAAAIAAYPDVESASVLDEGGGQLTDSVRNPHHDRPQKTVIFRPPPRGADHSLKEYVYLLPRDAGATYETAPYVPLPNATLCVTVTSRYVDARGRPRTLCLHVRADEPPAV